ncbi:aldo/keto reductase [Streptococcus sp. NLN64]|uniref:aldo/keto reductase n=1 Tax=Streptococcus sp. NLN64 TaxID=2822799 RepID=UPI0018C9C97E|nr:aldo/keto reductase [Streptococcus sp. NLN64]MBG9367254.1 aldo/keto reductase [Streptococcus sp. NLN64]
MEVYTLSNGVQIPKIGFGTWQIPEGELAVQSVAYALEAGYRHIDTAQIYGNEASVGQALAQSNLDRQDIFVTTKVWNDKIGVEDTRASLEESMEKLGLDYIDLVLIHWPNPAASREQLPWQERNAQVWKALESLYREGKIKAIGVSNFMIHHLEALLETAEVAPQVNQVMLAPGTPQKDLVAYCQEKGIQLEAYSPFGTGTLFENEEAAKLAREAGLSLAQLALAWSLDKGFVPLPKSTSPENIQANLAIEGLQIDPHAVEVLDKLQGVKGQLDPDQVDF